MGDAESGRGGGADGRARRAGRRRVSEPAQIAFGGTVLACALLDASPGGAQVFLERYADVPDLVTLRFPGGGSWPVRCCWQNGPHVGLEVVGTEPLVLPED